MSYDFRIPNITATTPEGQIVQIHSYLFQLSEQLLYAFNEVDKQEKAMVEKIQAKGIASGSGSNAEATNTFNAIKALIIKSADIVNAYYVEISKRLEGIYVAQSEFGTYTEQTSQAITENSEGIESLFTNIQEITSDLEEISSTLIDVEAHIKSGLLYYAEDGAPVYGLEIGQKNTIDGEEVFNKFARFTADRLSFYDQNDAEVAYVSDYKLYITEAQISGNLMIGSYVIDSSDGLLFRWAGD